MTRPRLTRTLARVSVALVLPAALSAATVMLAGLAHAAASANPDPDPLNNISLQQIKTTR